MSSNPPKNKNVFRRTWSIVATFLIFILLLSSLVAGTAEKLQGQMLRMGENMFGNPAVGVQYSFLRGDPQLPECDRNPDVDALVEQKMRANEADELMALIGDLPSKSEVRQSIESAQVLCEEKYAFYDKISQSITPGVKVFRKIETGMLYFSRLGVEYRPLLLALIVAIAAITTTLGLHHIAIRPPSTKRDFVIYSGNMVVANLLLTFSSGYYLYGLLNRELVVDSEKIIFNAIWVTLFAVLTIISIYKLAKPPKTVEKGSWLKAMLAVPLYATMGLLTSICFIFFMDYASGIGIYLGQMEELSGLFLNLALFIWIGMLLKQTHVVEYTLDVLRPFNFSPETLTWFLMLGAGVMTAYTGASGIFVIAAGAIIYREVLNSGARRQYALAVTAMSGSLGVVIRPSLLIVVIAALNSKVTTDALYGAGIYVFWLSSTLLFLVSLTLAKEKFKLRAPFAAIPDAARRLTGIAPYIVITLFVVFIVYEWMLGTPLNEFTAPLILPVVMIVILAFDKVRTHRVKDDYIVLAKNDRVEEQKGEMVDSFANDEQVKSNKGVGFMGAITLATSETIGHIGALILLMALSVAVGGLIERSEIMMAVPADLGGTLIAICLFTVVLVLIGMIMDPFGAAILVNATLAPIAYSNGIDPVHFWVIVLTAFELGYLTPPVALNQLLARQVVGEKEMADADAEVANKSFFWRYERWILPFSIMLVTLICVSFLPYFFKMFGSYAG